MQRDKLKPGDEMRAVAFLPNAVFVSVFDGIPRRLSSDGHRYPTAPLIDDFGCAYTLAFSMAHAETDETPGTLRVAVLLPILAGTRTSPVTS